MENKNKIIILIGAGGSGKTSIAKKLVETGGYIFAPTTTSRKIRKGEIHGVDYFFVSEEEFLKMIENEEFLEHITFNGNYYGTNKNRLKEILEKKHCILCIEANGAEKVKKHFKDQTISIFVYVPEEELEKRMKDRGDSQEHITRRIALAKEENKHKGDFDFMVENKTNRLDECVDEILKIVEKCK